MLRTLRLLVPGLCAAAIASTAPAADFPARPVTVVVPFPAGATTDTIARVLAQAAATTLGQPIVIENKPGAEGQVAAQDVAKAAPDGYRITLATSGNLSALPALRKAPPYDPVTDFTPIADVGRYAFFLYLHPSVPASSFKEFIAYAKANQGKLSYGTGNNTGVLMFAHVKSLFGLDMNHVPYKGEPPAMIDLVAGRVQAMIGTSIGVPYAKDGKLRTLVTLLPRRSPLVPDVPTLREIGMKDLTVVVWAALFGPPRMPKDAVERLNKEFVAAMQRSDVQAQMEKLGFALTPARPEALGTLVKDQLGIYRQLVRESGLQPE